MKGIMLIGEMGSGKTTAADYLASKYGFKKYSLAGKLKEICNDLWPNAGRREYQLFGTEVCRHIDEDVWINYLIRTAEENGEELIVVDDVRFLNEREKLGAWGLAAVKIVANKAVRYDRIKLRDGYTPQLAHEVHSSESGVLDIPHEYLVVNETSKKHLEIQLDRVVRELNLFP